MVPQGLEDGVVYRCREFEPFCCRGDWHRPDAKTFIAEFRLHEVYPRKVRYAGSVVEGGARGGGGSVILALREDKTDAFDSS